MMSNGFLTKKALEILIKTKKKFLIERKYS